MTRENPADNQWASICEQNREAILSVRCNGQLGTGWVMVRGRTRFILGTAGHVIADAFRNTEHVEIELLAPGMAEPIRCSLSENGGILDSGADLAVVEVIATNTLQSLHLFYQRVEDDRYFWTPDLTIGADVGWLGYPETTSAVFGRPTQTFCRGHISAIGMHSGVLTYCIDGNVNRGMSGSPIWIEDGTVIGVLSTFHAPGLRQVDNRGELIAYPGFGLAIPAGYLMQMVLRYIETSPSYRYTDDAVSGPMSDDGKFRRIGIEILDE